MVESRKSVDRVVLEEKKDARPRDLLARIIESKS